MEKNIKILTKMKNTVNSNIVKYIMLQFKMALFYVNTWSNVIYSCNEFSASLLQSSVSFRNYYNMLICSSRNISDYNQC